MAGLCASVLAGPAAGRTAAGRPAAVPILLDTDIGPDVDDAGATAALNALADLGEARILAMNCCTSSQWGAPCLDAINTYYGRPDVPIGTFKGSGFLLQSKYNEQVARSFPNDLGTGHHAPDATAVYRKVLSRQPDRSAVVCAVGPLNNLRALLDSPPDRFSRLAGRDLVARKVSRLVVMGGRYPEGKEWNFEQDPGAAARVMSDWPGPVLASGFEIGERVRTGRRLHVETPGDNPVRAAYALFPGAGRDRESWDQTGVLAAVRGAGRLWGTRAGGAIFVQASDGANRWSPAARADRAYLVERSQPEEVKTTIEDLMVRQPRVRSGS
jgi:hypothetical protein